MLGDGFYILEKIINTDNVSMLAIILDRIPYTLHQDFARYIMFGKWVMGLPQLHPHVGQPQL